jgi:hypothetical protein
MEVSLAPRSIPVSSLTSLSSPSAVSSSLQSAGPYATGLQGSSSLSVNTHSSGFSSVVPSTPEYHYEFERLQLVYKRSQEELAAERAFAADQQRLFERDRAEREARHQEQLEELRRQLPSSSEKGKGKERF